jgi:hypothetical protein
MKRTIVLGVGAALVTLAPVAGAQGHATAMAFADPMQVIVSADRLFGVHFFTQKVEVPAVQVLPGVVTQGRTETSSGTRVNLLWGGTGDFNGPGSVPRLGVDIGVGYHITVGGSVGYLHQSSSTKTTPQGGVSTEVDNPSANAWLFAPRGGFAFPLSDMFALWGRAGFTYYSSSQTRDVVVANTTQTAELSANGFQLNFEPMLVITPVPSFGFTIGGVADIPLSGSGTNKTPIAAGTTVSTDVDVTFTNFGLVAGILGYF